MGCLYSSESYPEHILSSTKNCLHLIKRL